MRVAPSPPSDIAIRCVTFYSYKGGVGRSMAVANVAHELAVNHGKRVLAIDWDLETPGLHFYFGRSDRSLVDQAGLLEYFETSKNEFGALEDNPSIERLTNIAQLTDYVTELTDFRSATSFGRISLMTCGRRDPSYFKRLERFDWRSLYEAGAGYWIVERLRRQARDKYDVVLIDAPAGRAPNLGVPLVQMPELVVMFFSSNEQGLMGTCGIAEALADHELRVLTDRVPLRVLMVPSNMKLNETSTIQWMNGPVTAVFDRLAEAGILDRRLQPLGPWQFALNTSSETFFDDALLARHPDRAHSPLFFGYSSLANAIAGFAVAPPISGSNISFGAQRRDVQRLYRALIDSIARGDQHDRK